ncbi:MAG: DNA methyltransferase [Armatimonadota bacterium]
MTEVSKRFVPNLIVEKAISKLAQDETGKRQYYRPIYSLHKWWARRPGTLFRAVILLATRPGIRDHLLQIDHRGDLVPSSPYFADHDIDKFVILDPFMGGGTTIVEANRMGAKVIGCDINPVAYWIVRESLKPIHVHKLRDYFHLLEKTTGERIKALYRTRCIHCHQHADTLYAFWVRTVACKHCGQQVLLHKRTLLNEGASRNRPLSESNPATVFCPSCLHLFEWGGAQPAQCPRCGNQFNPYMGHYNEGFYRCPHCGKQDVSLLDTIRTGHKLHEVLIAIEYWCPRCKKRLYKAPDDADRQLLYQIGAEYRSLTGTLVLPHQRIPIGASSRRWIQHGYRYYRDLFNMRQIVALNYLIDGIRGIEEPEYRNCFFTILSNMLEYNNMMTPYNYPHRKLHHLFNYHAMPLTTTPVENAVWGAFEEGAGTFVNCYKRYENAKAYCTQPYEKFKDSSGQVITVATTQEHIQAHFVRSYEELLKTKRGALLLCRDSSHLPEIPDGSVDFVITDPPYYDNVHYSELSNLFYVWLSLLVDDPAFQHELVPTEGEAVVNREMGKDHMDYQRLLTQVFGECHRVLKDTGKLIFTFHHSKKEAWWTVFEAVVSAGFRIVDFFPVQSEYRVNPHIRNKQAVDMDLVLICQKQSQPFEVLSVSPADALERALQTIGFYQNGGRNLVFLHFVGELLRSASCASEDVLPSYEWFESALSLFDSLQQTITTTSLSNPPAVQLALFDDKAVYQSESE